MRGLIVVMVLVALLATTAAAQCPTCPGGLGGGSAVGSYKADLLGSIPSQPTSYAPRWRATDGLSTLQHAIRVHGIDASLPAAEIYRRHDAYHDRHGGTPPGSSFRSSYRSRTTTAAAPVRGWFRRIFRR